MYMVLCNWGIINYSLCADGIMINNTSYCIKQVYIIIIIACDLHNSITVLIILQIVKKYDVILIQEVRGVNDPHAVQRGLLTKVGTNVYGVCNSASVFKPTSGSSHREMYLYLYR